MTREIFLNEIWKAYPEMPEIRRNIIFGRVVSLSPTQIILKRNSEEFSITYPDAKEKYNDQLGANFPVRFLEVGDVVIYCEVDACIYLLSPCLQKSKMLFSERPRNWSQFINRVRKFFLENNFDEILTPYLVDSPGVDHHIEFFEAKGSHTKRLWYLPTSPEINLKKHLCQGLDKIFEIKNCFRDDLPSFIHKHEFVMLEWYRAYESLEAIKKDIESILNQLSEKKVVFAEYSVADCFKMFANYELSPQTSLEELKELSEKLEVQTHPTDDWNDLYYRIFMEKIEPQLKKINNPIFLTQFPRQQASLAKINKQGWAERFELFWQGIELANAYLEVNDPHENKARFESEKQKRIKDQLPLSGYDLSFFEELYSGMPPASGVALGLDRLFMLLRGESSI